MRPMISAARSASSCPAGREPDAAADPLQQLRAGLGLEPGEVVGDRRLGVVQLLRRRGDRSVAGDGVDDAQPVDVQHASTLSMSQHESWHWTYESIGAHADGMTATQIRPTSRAEPTSSPASAPPSTAHADWSETAQLVADAAAPAPAQPGRADRRAAPRLARRATAATRCTSSPTARSRSSPWSGGPGSSPASTTT